MKKKFILIFIIIVVSIQSYALEDHILNNASLYIRSGFYDKAIEELDRIPINSEYFSISIAETTRLLYKLKKWNKFFAYMAYYKFFINKHNKKINKLFHPHPILLESMALTTLCRWRDAHKLLDTYKPLFRKFRREQLESLEKIDKSIYLLEQISRHKEVVLTKIDKSVTSPKVYWKISIKKLNSVKHPKYLEMDVTSKCVTR